MLIVYAIIATLLIGIFIGVVGTVAIQEWLESRDWSRYRAKKAQQDLDELAMADAVGVVRESGLAHEIIS